MENSNREKLLSIALKVPVFFTILLIIVKYVVYKLANSLSVFSSFTDSSLDLISSILSFVALKYSIKKETDNYKYGYTGIVDLTTLIIAIFILTTSATIYYKSIYNIINKNTVDYSIISILAMLFSTITSMFIALFLNFIYKKTKSILVKNEMAHYSSDILTNGGILISLIICKFYNHYLIDPVIAILMATMSVKPALEILANAINNIMSKEVDEETRRKIIEISTRDKNVLGYHKFKTRKSGDKIFIQIDIELPSELPFRIAHDIIDKIQKDVETEIHNSEIILHADPV